jgi:uncharacterized membrane protein
MEFFQAIEQLGAVRLLKSSFFAYPIVNALHIAAIGALLTSVVLMDFSVLGAVRSVPREKFVALLRRVALAAFAVAVLTGVTMFSIQATDYVRNPVFLLKLGLVVLAGLNFVAFTVLETQKRSGEASAVLRVLAVASILLWSSVLLAGRFIGFV